jgi:uncharacterized Tic20 family protein
MDNFEENISGEDKILSLFCHLSMVIGGILFPIIIWAIKKEHSKFVRFHSLQSIFFHLTFSVIIAVAIVGFAIIIIATGAGIGSSKSLHQTSGLSALIVILAFVFLSVIILAALAAVGYSIYLAVKSYQGEKTRIPIIGKIIYEKVYGKI